MDGVGLMRIGADDNTKIERAIGPASPGRTPYAINPQYAAFAEDSTVLVRNLKSQGHFILSLGNGRIRTHPNRVLAFSSARLNLLAIADGAHILVHDAESRKIDCTLKGNGHVVTSLCYSSSDPTVLASGSADGSICIWSLKEPSRPTHQLRGGIGPCSRIVINPYNARAVAAYHQGRISVWLLPAGRPKAVTNLNGGNIELLSWCPNNNGRLLGVSQDGRITVCNMRNVLGARSPQPEVGDVDGESDDEGEIIFGELEGMQQTQPVSYDLAQPVKQAHLFGHHGIVILPRSARIILFFSYSLESEEPTELWRLSVGAGVDCFTLRNRKASVDIVTCSCDGPQKFNVPTPVLDGMGWSYGRSLQWLPVLEAAPSDEKARPLHPAMLPHKAPIRDRSKRKRKNNTRYLAASVPQRAKRRRQKPSLEEVINAHEESAPKSMVDSLELPKIAPNEDDSPMPFLSPSIPARKVSPGPITPLDELMQLPRASFDTMSSAANQGHESDSDDETFAPQMQGSGTLLPGGVNVPLPRTCGACFGPNGQLAAFFPIRKTANTLSDDTEHMDLYSGKTHGQETSKLFPTFGNLGSANRHADDADLDSLHSTDVGLENVPQFAIQASSFDSRRSWPAKISPMKHEPGVLLGQQGVNITIHDLDTYTPTRRSLATRYQLASEENASDSDQCRSNAACAETEGLEDTAHAWKLLALILEQKDAQLLGFDEVLPFRDVRPKMSRNTSMASYFSDLSLQAETASFMHASSPLGGSWAIEELFAWAEDRADIQLLASMSAFLTERPPVPLDDTSGKYSTGSGSYSVKNDVTLDSTRSLPGIPILRTNSSGPRPISDSLVKSRGSRASSRNPSQPTTPYLDSSASTPPMTLPSLSRQASTGISQSGSTSPEHHRSSFSTAARNYAVSIAEKFGSYGSSPPSKKMGASPGHELPSSLPTGSLSKSVSFASGIHSSRTGQRSLSLAQEDDNYDSDRTIDDGSLPHTPKGPNTAVSVTVKQHAFFDETSTNLTSPALPADLALKCKIWRQCYAKQLRAWDLALIGAELENVSDHTHHHKSRRSKPPVDAIVPSTTKRKHTTCTVCFCLIRGAQQVCPECLHTTHPACLEEFITSSADIPFACPAGCGCDCSSATITSFSIEEDDADSVVIRTASPFRRKPSLTDPLRLRQKLQGESW